MTTQKSLVVGDIEQIVSNANSIWKDLNMSKPTIEWFRRGTIAGKAYYREHKVTFNEVLFMENTDKFKQTIIHECAHLVTKKLFPTSKPHGREWKYVMQKLGARPDRCHSYDVSTVKETRKPTKKYVYSCGCQEHLVGTQRHRNIQGKFKVFTCRKCSKQISYSGKVRTWK